MDTVDIHHTSVDFDEIGLHGGIQHTFKKSKWTADEDKLLASSVKRNGVSNWSLVASEVTGRTGKQCRERWMNQLCPELNKEDWLTQEDQILLKQQQIHGNVWSKISKALPGRSPNAVKNRWSWLSRHGIPDRFKASMGRYHNMYHYQIPRHTQQTINSTFNWEQLSRNPFPFSDPVIFRNQNHSNGSNSTSDTEVQNQVVENEEQAEDDILKDLFDCQGQNEESFFEVF